MDHASPYLIPIQLLVSRATQSSLSSNKWTTFELEAHTPSPLPQTLVEIGRYIAAALPFMANLELVTVAFDHHILLRFKKTSGLLTYVPLLPHLIPKLKSNLMAVSKVGKREISISAAKHVYKQNSGVPSVVASEMRLLVWSADVKVDVDEMSDLGSGLYKAMKKSAPTKCGFQLVYVIKSSFSTRFIG